VARASWFLPATLPQKKLKSSYLVAIPTPTPKATRKQFGPPENGGLFSEGCFCEQMNQVGRQRKLARNVRAIRNDVGMLSGLTAIVLAVSVIFGIVVTYANRAELAVDLGRLMPFSGTQRPADL
jgi:hypothetical protein